MSISDTAARPDGSARRLWQHADFLKLLAGETISDIGSLVGDLALPLAAALVLNATPGQMAALRAAEYVPRIVIGLVAGVWVDRLRRRPLQRTSDDQPIRWAAVPLRFAAEPRRRDYALDLVQSGPRRGYQIRRASV
jgi:hypothetical protein